MATELAAARHKFIDIFIDLQIPERQEKFLPRQIKKLSIKLHRWRNISPAPSEMMKWKRSLVVLKTPYSV